MKDDNGGPFDGSVWWRWRDWPRVEAEGTRPSTATDLKQLMDVSQDHALWVAPAELLIDLRDGSVPPQPHTTVARQNAGTEIRPRVEQQLGEGEDLRRVTFLLPNGWEALDGTNVCDPDDLLRFWNGRVFAEGDGWSVTIDPTGDTDWRQLKDTASYCFTHVGALARTDGSSFTGDDAFDILDRVRVALNLAVGRRTTCALPVGMRGGEPVWTRWRSTPVDPYRSTNHWLDKTIAARQVGKIIELVLTFSADTAAWQALRPAVAYYVTANNDVDVQLSVSVPISALQLLAYYRFVSDRQTYSNKVWKGLDTERQLRLLLEDINADLAVQPHFQHLIAAQTRLAQTSPLRDALGVVVKMRNIVTHPTRDKPAKFSIYEWAEAGMHARYWLCLALLNLVGYSDEVLASMGPQPPWTGQLRTPPWVTPDAGKLP